jgi:hypothetical protein
MCRFATPNVALRQPCTIVLPAAWASGVVVRWVGFQFGEYDL